MTGDGAEADVLDLMGKFQHHPQPVNEDFKYHMCTYILCTFIVAVFLFWHILCSLIDYNAKI